MHITLKFTLTSAVVSTEGKLNKPVLQPHASSLPSAMQPEKQAKHSRADATFRLRKQKHLAVPCNGGNTNAGERAEENNQEENCFHLKCVRLLGHALTDDAQAG